MANITEKEVEKLAFLSKIKLDKKEKSKYVKDLNAILSYVETLELLNTNDVLPTFQVTNVENVTRKDQADERRKEESEKLLECSSHMYKDYIEVPPIFDKRNNE